MSRSLVSFAVFAYNEEHSITAALRAIAACRDEANLAVHVLINGCTDGTEQAVRRFRVPGLAVRPVVIARGDKANAWNLYTHDIAPADACMHVFTDGDQRIGRGSVAAFLRSFASNPQAGGCAGLPNSGRSLSSFRAKLVRQREMAGNLYAIRGECLARFRRRGVRLPFGIFGEDGLVTTLIKYDLDFRRARVDTRIAVAEEATFHFEPLSPLRPRDWRIYHNRKMRYAVRKQQAGMLYPLLRKRGLDAMPAHVVDLYHQCQHALALQWSGFDTVFDWTAIRRIRRDIQAGVDVRFEDKAHLYS